MDPSDSDERATARSEAEALFSELRRRIKAGEDVSIDAFCAEHPAHADELRALHAAFASLTSALHSARGAPDAAARPDLDALLEAPDDDEDDPQKTLRDVVDLAASGAGRYADRDEVGRGGMGEVRRVHDAALRRDLAMKVMRPPASPDDDDAPTETRHLARFLDEAFITSQLDHPGIVPVHDVGVGDDGRAYFTMKLVRGKNLADVLDEVHSGEGEWTTNRVLGALQRVCEAVAYAHARGVLHRDIKPANIMVGRYGETYLMDWGLACVAGEAPQPPGTSRPGELPDDAEATGWFGSPDTGVIGTPVYMSPEQALGNESLVDERSDVYSLGAILYHLLAGRLPYVEPDELPLRLAVLLKVRQGPPRPLREVSPAAPESLVRICEKAMAREVKDRYRGASELATALQDYLADISEDREEARRQARRAELINRFLIDMLGSGDPANAQGHDVSVREVLDKAAGELGTTFRDHPLDEAALQLTIGALYKKLGQTAEGRPHLQRGVELQRKVLGDEHRDTLAARVEEALADAVLDRLDEAEETLRDVLEQQERLFGRDDADTARTMYALASVLRRTGLDPAQSEELYRLCLDVRRRVLGDRHPDTLATLNSLALLMNEAGRGGEVVELQAEALTALVGIHGALHPSVLIAKNDLASQLHELGRMDEAEEHYRSALEGQRHVLGDDHHQTITTISNLANHLRLVHRFDEAQALMAEALEATRRVQGADHRNTLGIMHNHGLVQLDAGQAREGLATLRDCVARMERVLAPEHKVVARCRYNIGRCLAALDRHHEAVAELRSARDVLRGELGPDHPWVRDAIRELAAAERRRTGETGEQA